MPKYPECCPQCACKDITTVRGWGEAINPISKQPERGVVWVFECFECGAQFEWFIPEGS